jgi:hypothetical protein
MPTTLRHSTAPLRYTPPTPGSPEAERTGAYRARKTVVRRLEQLIVQGKLDQALQFALPVTALLDTAPTLRRVLDILDELTLVDAREDVARQLFRQDPERHRASYKAHLQLTIQRMTEALRALEVED